MAKGGVGWQLPRLIHWSEKFSLKSVADNIKGRVQFMRQIHVFLLEHLKRAFQEALKEKERGKNVAF